MNTGEFLRFILPSQGIYYAVWIKNEGQPVHFPLHTPEEVAEKSQQLSNQGNNAYHACASYAQESYVDDNGKTRWRTADNAAFVKSQWLDLDIKTQYTTKKEALVDLGRFCAETGIKRPNVIVDSGNGIHCYWVFNRDIPRDTWVKMAELFKAVCAHFKLGVDDTSRTADVASVLRPIGTVNDKRHKGKGIKDVVLVGKPREALVNPTEWVGKLTALKAEHGIKIELATKSKDKTSHNPNAALLGGMEYPESSAEKIAEKCAQIRNFRDFKGVGQDYQTWRNCIGIVKHCVESDELCHAWSSEHEDYDVATCQGVIDKWNAGPTTCEKFRKDAAGICAGCSEEVSSPILLGRLDPKPAREIVTQDGGVEEIPALPEEIENSFRFVRGKGLLARHVNDDGEVEWQLFTTVIPYVTDYYLDTDTRKWMVTVKTWLRSKTWYSANIEAGTIAAGGFTLVKELGSYCMVSAVFGQTKHLENYMKLWVEHMRMTCAETEMQPHFGWLKDRSFVLGDRAIFPDGSEKFVTLKPGLKQYAEQYEPKGDLDRYVELIDKLYNRPQHQAYQFTWMAGFASVLIPMVHVGPVGAIMSAHSNNSGLGKSTAQQLAFGIWGDPTWTAHGDGATPFARFREAGFRHHLPMSIDEVSQWQPEELASFAYRYSSGLPKIAGLPDGSLRDVRGQDWANICILSTNKSVISAITSAYSNPGPRIMRIWEYSFPEKHDLMVNKIEGARYINELLQMRGVAGTPFIKYVVANYDKVYNMVQDADAEFTTSLNLQHDARFWTKIAASVWAAFQITHEMGLHAFDRESFIAWMKASLRDLMRRVGGAATDLAGLFGDMMAELQSGFIVTDEEGDRRGKDGKLAREVPGFYQRGTVTGRAIIKENRVYVSIAAMRSWCKTNNVDMEEVIRVTVERGWYKGRHKFSLGKGTLRPVPQQQVLELDWSAFMDRANLTDLGAIEASHAIVESEQKQQ